MAFPLARKLAGSRGAAIGASTLRANPVLINDLRLRMRRRTSIATITFYLLAMCLALAIYLIRHGSFGDDGNPQAGVQLFQALAIIQLALILFVTPASTASAISGERRTGTWDLLIVTRLTNLQIVWGKFVGGVVFNIVLALAPLPLYGVPLVLGGVNIVDIVQMYAVFFVTIVLLTAIGLPISVLTRPPSVSIIISTGISLVLGVGLSIITIVGEVQPQIAVLSDIGQLASPPSNPAPLGIPAQIDPLVALLSVLPSGSGGTALGDLGTIQHAFGLPLVLAWWAAFAVLTVLVGGICLAVSSWLLRPQPVGSRVILKRLRVGRTGS